MLDLHWREDENGPATDASGSRCRRRPLGAFYEIGCLHAIEEAFDGFELDRTRDVRRRELGAR
jgi:hypothetical protein